MCERQKFRFVLLSHDGYCEKVHHRSESCEQAVCEKLHGKECGEEDRDEEEFYQQEVSKQHDVQEERNEDIKEERNRGFREEEHSEESFCKKGACKEGFDQG